MYTGDFNPQRRLILKPARQLRADILVIEATYGHPRYIFPDRPVIYTRILHSVRSAIEEGKNLVLSARRIGVAQELTSIISFLAKDTPLVYRSIAEVNSIYEEFGENLGNYVILENEVDLARPFIYPLSKKVRKKRIICTGWAVDYGGLPLSSHADFKDLIKYVKESRAEEIYTVYGFSKSLAEQVSKEIGVNASPL